MEDYSLKSTATVGSSDSESDQDLQRRPYKQKKKPTSPQTAATYSTLRKQQRPLPSTPTAESMGKRSPKVKTPKQVLISSGSEEEEEATYRSPKLPIRRPRGRILTKLTSPIRPV